MIDVLDMIGKKKTMFIEFTYSMSIIPAIAKIII